MLNFKIKFHHGKSPEKKQMSYAQGNISKYKKILCYSYR